MRNKIVLAIAAIALAIGATTIIAGPQGAMYHIEREALAKAMVTDAITAYQERGTASFEEFAGSEQFHDKELYVFVVNRETSRIVAHGVDSSLIGRDTTGIIDSEGTNVGQLIEDAVTPDGEWVDYIWTNPETGKEGPKSSWVRSHDGYVFGVGIYGP